MDSQSRPFWSPRFYWVASFLVVAFVLVWTSVTLQAQPAPDEYYARSMDELQQLVAPIALYPDALLAQVLTASTYPDDVIAAARWEDAGNDPGAADSQP